MSELSSGTKGAMAELRVAIHLMGLGFHVARMLSPNLPTDLYAAKGRRILRVQVESTLSLNQLKNLRNGGNDLFAPTAAPSCMIEFAIYAGGKYEERVYCGAVVL